MKYDLTTLLMAAGGFVLLILAIVLCIVLCIIAFLRREPPCKHAFTLEQVTDLNQDPKCEYCKKYLSAIDPHQRCQFVWDNKQGKFQLAKIKRK